MVRIIHATVRPSLRSRLRKGSAAKRDEGIWWYAVRHSEVGRPVGGVGVGGVGRDGSLASVGGCTGTPSMRRWWGALVLAALIVLSAGLAQTGQGHALLQDAGLYEAPASYTELAFTAPRNLPSQLRSDRAPIGVSFRIHNVSMTSRTYSWSIALARSGRSHVGVSGVVTVPGQGWATVARTVTITCVGGRVQVVVRLAGPAESIDFWATCPAQTRRAR